MSAASNPIENLRFKTVFISYSSHNKDLALTFVRKMEALGCECWIACEKVRPGDEWDFEVIQALKKAEAIILLITKSANESKRVLDEIKNARTADKPVIGIRVDGTMPSERLAFWISTQHYLDAASSRGDWETVAQSILSAQPKERTTTGSSQPWKTLTVGFACLVAVIFAAGWGWHVISSKPDQVATVPIELPKMELLTSDEKPLTPGHEVQAHRSPDGAGNWVAAKNNLQFVLGCRELRGDTPAKCALEVQFDATEVKAPLNPPLNTSTVDASVVSDAKFWSPVHRINRALPRLGHPYQFSSWLADGNNHTPANGFLKLTCGLNNGPNGFFPEGKMPVRVVFHSTDDIDSPSIAEADIILVIPPPWSFEPPHAKARLLGQDRTALDSKPVIAIRTPASELTANAGQTISFLNQLDILEDNVQGPASLNLYLLHARFLNENRQPNGQPWDGKEIVIDDSVGFQRCHVLNDELIKLPAPDYMGNVTFPKGSSSYPVVSTKISAGPKGLIPAGIHEVGVEIVRGTEQLYRTKLTLVVPP